MKSGIIEAIKTRKSVRSFDGREVDDSLIFQVLEAGKYAPTAMNAQTRQIVAVKDKKILSELNAAVMMVSDNATVKRVTDRMPDKKFSFFYNAPVFILTAENKKAVCPEENCACALENMFLAAHALGLGACWINQLKNKFDLPEIRDILSKAGIRPENGIYGCCALGYAAIELPIKAKTGEISIV